MTESQIYSLQASNFINNVMFQVRVVISMFIAFRLSRVTNEMGAGIAMKGLATPFWFGCSLFQFRYGCVASRYFSRYGSKACCIKGLRCRNFPGLS